MEIKEWHKDHICPLIFTFLVIIAYRHHKDMTLGKHYISHFFGGLICGFFLELDAASLLNITIKVDVNEKTAIDQSYPTGKLIRSVSMGIEIRLIKLKLHQKIKMKVLFFCLRCRCFSKRLVTSCAIHWIQAQVWQTIH